MNIKDYIHYYIGCPFIYNGGPKVWDGWEGFKKGGAWYYKDDNFIKMGGHDFMLSKIQLVLRRLSDMTEEEAVKLIHLRSDALIDIQDVELSEGGTGINYTHRYRIASRRFKKFCYLRDLNSSQFHYLLKQGFDLFGLIDAGLAVDAKTLNTKNK